MAVVSAAPRPVASPVSGVAGSGTPPFRLPGEHFAAALAFWLAGAVGLVVVAPELAAGAFPDPRVVAVAHLFTLGWITTSIQGALYQFLPVALGVPIRSERLAHATFALYVPGIGLFVAGMLAAAPLVFLPGAALFGTALLLFSGNLVATLRNAASRNLTWWALAGAIVFLLITVVLGASLTGNLRWSYLGAHRFLALGVHLHVAVAGWVMLVVVGVAHKLLPMFLLSHGAGEWAGRAAGVLIAGGTALLVLLHHRLSPAIVGLVSLLIGGGVAAFLVQAGAYLRHRKKPRLDPGLRLAGGGLVFLAVALGMAPAFLGQGLDAPRLATAYGFTLVVGALSLFVAGHYYKIVPFLVWYHRYGPLVGKRPVPKVTELYAAGPADAAALALVVGTGGTIAGILAGVAPVARSGTILFAIGAGIVVMQIIGISRRRPE